MINPEELSRSLEVNKQDPNSYNMQEDTENREGCQKDKMSGSEPQMKKPQIYSKSSDPYYDPTYEARLQTFNKEIEAVPVVLERDLQTDQQALENQRRQLYANKDKYYYDPSVLDHIYEVDNHGIMLIHYVQIIC